MRKPLTPLQAFAEDARSAAARAIDLGDELITWLSVAQTADHLSMARGASRAAVLAQARALLVPFAEARPTMVHDARPAPESEIARLAEQFRVVVEAMEQAGCFELAYSTMSAVCRLTAAADYVTASLSTLHLGRVARQMNDLPTAEDCYVTMLNTSIRERDGPLAARGHIGLALLHDMRGNLPAAEAEYRLARALSVPMSSAFAAACQGLMSLAMSRDRLADALLYGWELYDATEHDFDARTAVLADLSIVAMNAGFHDAALRGFEHALTLSQVPRIRLITLAGAVRAAAHIRDTARVREFDSELVLDIARVNVPYAAAQALLHSAEAWTAVDVFDVAQSRIDEALGIAQRFGYHEYQFRGDALTAQLGAKRQRHQTQLAPTASVQATAYHADPIIEHGIHRLEQLAR